MRGLGVCAAGVLLAACGGGDDDDSQPKKEDGNACSSEISNNHGHSLTISAADQAAGAAKSYDIKGGASHSHTVELDADDFAELKSGTSLIVTSSIDAGHSHDVEITC